jgi:hypothetical protein
LYIGKSVRQKKPFHFSFLNRKSHEIFGEAIIRDVSNSRDAKNKRSVSKKTARTQATAVNKNAREETPATNGYTRLKERQ